MEPVTIKTIAKQLGLSIATVSRALNDSYGIGEATRAKVKAMADSLGYQPNAYASGLKRKGSKTIAVVLPGLDNNFFTQVISGIESVAHQKGFHVLVYLTHEDQQREKEILQIVRNGRTDGILISVANSSGGYAHIEQLAEAGMPIVFVDRICEHIDVPGVVTNNEASAFEATKLLLARGCRKIAFLGMAPQLFITGSRKNGYLKALRSVASEQEPIIQEFEKDHEKNIRLLTDLLKHQQPDGLFAVSEKVALLVYEVCGALKLRIPEDIKLVGFTNMPAAAFLEPSMSAIVQPAVEMGERAAELLFKVIGKKKIFEIEKKQVLPSVLKIRRSAG